MNASDYWTIFLETGAPEVYLMFHKARRMEEAHVFNDTGSGAADNGL